MIARSVKPGLDCQDVVFTGAMALFAADPVVRCSRPRSLGESPGIRDMTDQDIGEHEVFRERILRGTKPARPGAGYDRWSRPTASLFRFDIARVASSNACPLSPRPTRVRPRSPDPKAYSTTARIHLVLDPRFLLELVVARPPRAYG